MNSLQKLLDLLNRLENAGLPYSIEHSSEESILVMAAVEGERWEIEISADGTMQVEVFYSAETEFGMEGEEALERLFDVDGDDDDEDEDDEDDDEDFDDESDDDADEADDEFDDDDDEDEEADYRKSPH